MKTETKIFSDFLKIVIKMSLVNVTLIYNVTKCFLEVEMRYYRRIYKLQSFNGTNFTSCGRSVELAPDLLIEQTTMRWRLVKLK